MCLQKSYRLFCLVKAEASALYLTNFFVVKKFVTFTVHSSLHHKYNGITLYILKMRVFILGHSGSAVGRFCMSRHERAPYQEFISGILICLILNYDVGKGVRNLTLSVVFDS